MPHPHPKVWTLVMDGDHAYIAEIQSEDTPPLLIHEFSQDPPLNHVHGPDSPGRSFQSFGASRHAYEKRHDWHDYQKELFAKHAALILDQSEPAFDRLVVIAPPRILGVLRESFSKKVQAKITKEFGKDIAHLPVTELLTHLKSYLEA